MADLELTLEARSGGPRALSSALGPVERGQPVPLSLDLAKPNYKGS